MYVLLISTLRARYQFHYNQYICAYRVCLTLRHVGSLCHQQTVISPHQLTEHNVYISYIMSSKCCIELVQIMFSALINTIAIIKNLIYFSNYIQHTYIYAGEEGPCIHVRTSIFHHFPWPHGRHKSLFLVDKGIII